MQGICRFGPFYFLIDAGRKFEINVTRRARSCYGDLSFTTIGAINGIASTRQILVMIVRIDKVGMEREEQVTSI
jgi:hypothetical protein